MDGTAGSYTAGTGISISNDEISVDSTVVALKSDLGDELPPIASGDAGKVLKVNAGETAVEWANDASQTYTGGTGIDITNNVISVDNTIATKSELFSGDYDDLTDKPDLSVYAESSDLATVATSGDYDDLTNKPTIPAALSAGTGIDITSNVVSIDNTVALKSDIPAAELPTIASGDAGKALVVNSGETGVEWATVGGGSDNVKVITLTDKQMTNPSRIPAAVRTTFTNIITNGWDAEPVVLYISNGSKKGYYEFDNAVEGSPNEITFRGEKVKYKFVYNFGGTEISAINLDYVSPYTAGTNITISNGTISASGGATYTAGTGLNLSSGAFSVDTSWLAEFVDDIVNPKPFLNTLQLSYEDNGDDVYLVNLINQNIKGHIINNGRWYWDFQNFTISEAIDDQIYYDSVLSGEKENNQFNDNGNGMFQYDSQNDVWFWENGPTSIYFTVSQSTDTTGELEVVFDPNWEPSGNVPDLTRLWVGYGDEPNVVDMIDLDSQSISGFIPPDNKYHYSIEGITLPEAFQNQSYGYAVVGDNSFQDMGDGTAVWVDDNDFHAWVISNGPVEIDILPQQNLNVDVEVVYDPNWEPPVSNVPNLTGFKLGSSGPGDMVDMTGITVSGFTLPDGKYHWQLQNVNFGTVIVDNNSYILNASTDDGPSGQTMGGTTNAEWVNDGVVTGWAFHPSNSPLYEVFITVTAQSDTTGDIEIVQDPEWTPSN